MKRLISGILLLWIAISPVAALADAQVHEWIGHYDMNHDGWTGTLTIEDSRQDCGASRWCHLVLKYRDPQGRTFMGKIAAIDDKYQHMVFYIYFPNNTQRFDAYLFSWDKNKMAGTTYWEGRAFGFFAIKQ